MPRRENAGRGELIIEPRGRAAAEVRTHRAMNGRKDLQQHENDAKQRERDCEIRLMLDGAHQRAHGDGENGREQSPQNQHGPPNERESAVSARQCAGNRPKIAGAELLDDWSTHFVFTGLSISIRPPDL